MKYNLQVFSQEVASELNIDGIDLYLLRWFVDFKDTNQMDTKIRKLIFLPLLPQKSKIRLYNRKI